MYLYLRQILSISALWTDSSFHLPAVDIFEYDQNHNMDSEHFLNWIERTLSLLRRQLDKSICSIKSFLYQNDVSAGPDAKVVILLDNAT